MRCPTCGGALGSQAQWCGLCHADLRPTPPPPTVPQPAAAEGSPARTAGLAPDPTGAVRPGTTRAAAADPDAAREALLVADRLLAMARAEADRQRPGLPGGWQSRSARTGLGVGLGVLLMLALMLVLLVLGSLV